LTACGAATKEDQDLRSQEKSGNKEISNSVTDTDNSVEKEMSLDDLKLFAAVLNSSEGDNVYDPRYDFDKNGTVNIDDFAALIGMLTQYEFRALVTFCGCFIFRRLVE